MTSEDIIMLAVAVFILLIGAGLLYLAVSILTTDTSGLLWLVGGIMVTLIGVISVKKPSIIRRIITDVIWPR